MKHTLEFKKGCWICSCCNAKYKRPKNEKPKIEYCMKCKVVWE